MQVGDSWDGFSKKLSQPHIHVRLLQHTSRWAWDLSIAYTCMSHISFNHNQIDI